MQQRIIECGEGLIQPTQILFVAEDAFPVAV
jgi:hypothetical protein